MSSVNPFSAGGVFICQNLTYNTYKDIYDDLKLKTPLWFPWFINTLTFQRCKGEGVSDKILVCGDKEIRHSKAHKQSNVNPTTKINTFT